MSEVLKPGQSAKPPTRLNPCQESKLVSSAVLHEALLELDKMLRPGYEGKLWLTGPSTLALICGQLVANGVRWSGIVNHVYRAGFTEEADWLLRTPLENFANLFYILYAGPAEESRTREDLVAQFETFGALQHQKLINKTKDWVTMRRDASGTVAGKPMSEAQLTAHFAATAARAKTAESLYPAIKGRDRWHTLSMEDMLLSVEKHMPSFARWVEELLQAGRQGITMCNFALHCSSFMFVREPASAHKGELLSHDSAYHAINQGAMAASLAVLNWQALAEVFGAEELVVYAKFQEIANDLGKTIINDTGLSFKPSPGRN